jgi:hypothetical protein
MGALPAQSNSIYKPGGLLLDHSVIRIDHTVIRILFSKI